MLKTALGPVYDKQMRDNLNFLLFQPLGLITHHFGEKPLYPAKDRLCAPILLCNPLSKAFWLETP
jgi:hypothetical protein